MFADDGVIARKAVEVHRALAHLVPLMPRLGLKLWKLNVIPALEASSQMDVQAFKRLGCKVLAEAQITIIKCPIGTLHMESRL